VKKLRKYFLIVVFLSLLVIVLSACVPKGMSDTTVTGTSSLKFVYQQIYNQSMESWRSVAVWGPFWIFLAILATGILAGIYFQSQNDGNSLVYIAGFFFVVAFLAALMTRGSIIKKAPLEAEKAATAGMTEGVDKKKQEISMRYLEYLNAPFAQTLPESGYDPTVGSSYVKVCKPKLNDRTNCYPFERTYEVNVHWDPCPTDDDEDKECKDSDTQHDPVFTHLVRYSAQVSMLLDRLATPETRLVAVQGVQDRPIAYFSGWSIPQFYDLHFYSKKYHKVAGGWTVAPPVDWVMYRQMEELWQVMEFTTLHQYSNPLLATANSDFMADESDLARLEAANLLLKPRTLYSPVGGDFPGFLDDVHFLGSLQVPKAEEAKFQRFARQPNMYWGNKLHIVNTFAFALESDITAQGLDIDALTFLLKADMYRESKWNQVVNGTTLYTIMQQNTVLTVCAVRETAERGRFIPPANCRVVVGLPIGNELLKEAFTSGLAAEMQDVPFTAEGFFGNPQLSYSHKTDVPELVLTGTQGHPMGMWETYAAMKPSMNDNFGYLVDKIQLSKGETQEVINHEVSLQQDTIRGYTLWPQLLLLVYFFLGLAFLLMAKAN